MLKKILTPVVLFTVLALTAQAQRYSREYEEEPERENRPFYGAYLNLLVGDYTNVGISPFIGYAITSTTEIGAGPFYQHTFIRRQSFGSYGGRAFVRQAVYRQFFAQAEYEYMDTREANLEELFEKVWGMDAIGDNATVTVHISKLREKIEADPSNPQYIETIWGVGYRMKV